MVFEDTWFVVVNICILSLYIAVPFGSFHTEVASGKAHVLQLIETVLPWSVSVMDDVHVVFFGEAERQEKLSDDLFSCKK